MPFRPEQLEVEIHSPKMPLDVQLAYSIPPIVATVIIIVATEPLAVGDVVAFICE